jgi:hypothetical protein
MLREAKRVCESNDVIVAALESGEAFDLGASIMELSLSFQLPDNLSKWFQERDEPLHERVFFAGIDRSLIDLLESCC